MRRLIGWTAGVIGIAALARALSRRQARHERATVAPPVDDRAEALRRKLDETRAAEPVPAVDVTEPDAPKESLDERRARVHAKAQEAIEAMQEEPPA